MKDSSEATPASNDPRFGQAIRARRRELGLTQDQVATQIGTSKPYVAHLESGNRHPSDKIVARLAEVLGLDGRELFFLANPHARALVSGEDRSTQGLVWEQFENDLHLRHIHDISIDEMEILRRVTLLGEIRSSRDLIYVLNAIRQALGR